MPRSMTKSKKDTAQRPVRTKTSVKESEEAVKVLYTAKPEQPKRKLQQTDK